MTNQLKTKILENIPLGLVAILGISFWFWLAYPWENSNESYGFINVLKNSSILDMFTKNIVGSTDFRPLMQFVAYAGYKLTGGDIYAHQLFNYVVAILAWFFASLAIKEKNLFSITSMLVGGFLFSGYIYLFHLHGVGYSPVLLLITSFIYLFDYRQKYDNITIALALILTVVAWFFHPIALLIFIGYFGGFMFEKLRYLKKAQYILSALLLLLAGIIVILIFNIAGNKNYTSSTFTITSYKMIEVHWLISIFSFVLTIATIESVERLERYHKLLIELIFSILSIWLFYNNLPVMILWIIASLFKMIILRKWSIAFLIITTATFPLGLMSGTPSYAIYVIMACSLALPHGWQTLEEKIKFVNLKTVVPIYIVVLILIILLRTGTNIPIISPLTKPILAEKEKTYQLKATMDWVLNSKYRNYNLVLHREKYNPSENTKGSIERANTAPMSQRYVDIYMQMMRGAVEEQRDSSKKLIVTFGNEKIDDMYLLRTIDGKFADKAMIYFAHHLTPNKSFE
jgi:hypothetical protein